MACVRGDSQIRRGRVRANPCLSMTLPVLRVARVCRWADSCRGMEDQVAPTDKGGRVQGGVTALGRQPENGPVFGGSRERRLWQPGLGSAVHQSCESDGLG